MRFKVAFQIIYITLSCFVALLEDSLVAMYVTSVFLVITFFLLLFFLLLSACKAAVDLKILNGSDPL